MYIERIEEINKLCTKLLWRLGYGRREEGGEQETGKRKYYISTANAVHGGGGRVGEDRAVVLSLW